MRLFEIRTIIKLRCYFLAFFKRSANSSWLQMPGNLVKPPISPAFIVCRCKKFSKIFQTSKFTCHFDAPLLRPRLPLRYHIVTHIIKPTVATGVIIMFRRSFLKSLTIVILRRFLITFINGKEVLKHLHVLADFIHDATFKSNSIGIWISFLKSLSCFVATGDTL